jgi:hypothetical protein
MNNFIFVLKKMLKKNILIKKCCYTIVNIFRKVSQDRALNYINRNYKHIFEYYNKYNEQATPFVLTRKIYPVWVCWFQGEENMPEIIKVCYNSILKNANGHEINLITSENYFEFVDVPDYIIEKHRKLIINDTKFSNIIRSLLLSKYGGLWLDATVYISGVLPDFKDLSYWTTIMKRNDGRYTYSEFIAYCLPNDILWSLVRDFLFDYWRHNDKVIDYFMLSIFIDCAYKNISAIKEIIDKVPLVKRSVFELYGLLNQEYNMYEYKILCDAISFHKLTYKEDFNKYTKDGKLTYYGYLVQEWEKTRHESAASIVSSMSKYRYSPNRPPNMTFGSDLASS